MSSREVIINKLKRANIKDKSSIPTSIADKDIFSDYPNKNSLLQLFSKRFEALRGELQVAKDSVEAGEKLKTILSSLNGKKYITFSSKLTKSILSSIPDLSKQIDILGDEFLESDKLASYSVGLTTADLLVARTGSIILNSLNHGGRRLSVLPPVHIVIADTSQIVFSLDDIFNNDFFSIDWSYCTIISGPSRTSDIEKQLVLGAHGPKRLIVILIDNI